MLEHIEKDSEEIKLAQSYLKKNGYLIILVPAHNFLYSSFDKAIGHFRRYNKSLLNTAIPHELKVTNMFYLDSSGLILSFMSKLIMKQSYPTKNQMLIWDRIFIPLSKIIDKMLFHHIGKTLIDILQK